MNDRLEYPFKNDQEVLIALVEDFNNSVSRIDNKMLEDHQDTLEIKKLLQEEYKALGDRIALVEKDLGELDPRAIATVTKDVQTLKEWHNDYRKTRHIAWIVASSFFVLLGYLINLFAKYIFMFHR